jgi:hypothetical protein
MHKKNYFLYAIFIDLPDGVGYFQAIIKHMNELRLGMSCTVSLIVETIIFYDIFRNEGKKQHFIYIILNKLLVLTVELQPKMNFFPQNILFRFGFFC